MSSGPDTSGLDQLAEDVVPVPSCCALSAIIPSLMLGSLLDVALSEEVSK